MRYCLIAMLFLLSCSYNDLSTDCINEDDIKPVACYEVYRPVCGCNGVTYSNDCYAKSAGVQFWTDGKCRVK